MGMKFINAKFFYKSSELIDKEKYSYWWILMGELNSYGSTLESVSDASIKEDEWTALKRSKSSYSFVDGSSSSVKLKNAYICGIAGTSVPVIGEDPNNMGNVVLTASGSKSNSIIPFTVGQDNSTIGHRADSLWLLALSNQLNDDNVQDQLFPFVIDSDSNGSITTQKYAGPKYDISDSNNICIPLIGYNVSSDNAVNSVNYSGFTVGTSVVTLSGLYSDAEKN
jgi:hypothetical protein